MPDVHDTPNVDAIAAPSNAIPADGRASFVVDIGRAEVIAGNAAARAFFLGTPASAVAVDLATSNADLAADEHHATPSSATVPRPAVRYTQSLDRSMPALRALAGIALGCDARLQLVFWTGVGAISVAADCSGIVSPLGDPLVRVVLVPPTRIGAAPSPMGDAETLADIARRIRSALPDAPDAPDAPERNGEPAAPTTMDMAAAAVAARPRAAIPQLIETAASYSRPVVRPGSDRPEPTVRPRPAVHPEPPVRTEGTHVDAWTDLKLAKLAHELRTPLSAVVALAEIMRDERLGPMANARYRGYAADIFESTNYALTLIQSVIDDVRGDTAPDRAFTPFDANRVIASSVSALDPFADRAGVTLIAAIAPRLPVPAIESRRLTQILFSVLTNAFDHTPRGGRITVSAEARGGDGWLALRIEDTGRGMSSTEIEKALARTVATARPGSSPSGSTGFGVPIVRDIVSAAGGSLGITSVPGRGTRVTIALPPLRP